MELNVLSDKIGTTKNDARITKIGAILRKTSLDELPQLYNVFKGDMSFVGPRPLLKEYLSEYDEFQRKRHSVLPGLTGLAQVNGRNFLDWIPRLKLDVEYVNTVSLKVDFSILIKTIYKVVASKDISVDATKSQPYLDELRKNQVIN